MVINWKLKAKPLVLAIFVTIVILSILFQVSAQEISHLEIEGIEGIHIMPDESVMLGTGQILIDATITANGLIMLGSGEIVKPVMDMREKIDNPDSLEIDITDMNSGGNIINGSSIEKIGEEGISGIHIMPNGRVMTGTGDWVDDATVTSDGQIMLGSGELVEPMMDMRQGQGIRRGANSMVVNENFDRLPLGCGEIIGEQHIKVVAGVSIAQNFPGTVYTYDVSSIDVEPCTLLTVTFENKDNIRHQFMVHDLPRDTYTMGMFNIEVTGPGEETGTFITPPDQETLFVHCGVPGHEAKGMKTQIKVAGGRGDLHELAGIETENDLFQAGGARKNIDFLLGISGIILGFIAYFLYRYLKFRKFNKI